MSARAYVTGNLTRDPVLQETPDGVPVLTVGVAVTDAPDGQTHFFCVTAWRDLALEMTALAKGARVAVSGRLAQRSWETETGERRSVVEIVADDIALSMAPTWVEAQP